MFKVIQAGQYVQVKSRYLPYTKSTSKALIKSLPRLALGNELNRKRNDNLSRVRNRLKLLAHANATTYSKFITLTTKEQNTTMEQFQGYLHLWLKQLKRDLLKGFGTRPKNERGAFKLKYIGVYERQERGTPHAHIIFFNQEFINWELALKRWRSIIGGIGSVQIKKLESIKHINYIVSYLNIDMLKSIGQKSVIRSVGLKEPEVYIDHLPNHLKNLSLKVDYSRIMGHSTSGDNVFENVFGYLTRTHEAKDTFTLEQATDILYVSITRINAFNKIKERSSSISVSATPPNFR